MERKRGESQRCTGSDIRYPLLYPSIKSHPLLRHLTAQLTPSLSHLPLPVSASSIFRLSQLLALM